ncbi:nuclear mitotic apparatus protein 1 isoform X2 [Rhinichthys klamathensis goyatoka]|uniref:nuclear mitotic apparatus protein 1 isoform X2 n=1 Tax=Rhinichthys klamathensis goyatoka TaxID=3034132 RepID=UPI0024B549FF|nr:nuclear mitotic apparatus protein 1 isoform X2 [Rhinichthys klamathensis goyatoka]
MKFNRNKAGPLLIWMNAMFPEKPIWEFAHMRDGVRLLEIFGKLNGEENIEVLKTLSLDEKLKIIFSDLHDKFYLTKRQSFLILQKINHGIDLELQLAKVMLLLCYCSFKKGNLIPLDSRTELPEITSMFRFVKVDLDGLSLDEGLDQFLDQDPVTTVVNSSGGSSGSSLSYTDDESPFFSRFQRLPRVQFQELCTVASSSDSSPVPDLMSTPHFQLKRLRKELAHEGDVRDELEKELTDQINIISEKEGLIVQLQHRVDRMLREQRELEKDHKAALLELQEKNESLLRRVHEVVKQCHDLKTENSQKDKKIDELTEENQTFAAQVRNTFAQLARAEEEVTKLTLAHESSLAEWRSRKELLEHELNEAVTHRECLSEQVQILQGKISVLEDELLKAQSQERGEVLGPIMEWEKLKQELADLTLKLAVLQDTISRLEKEKTEVEALLAEERASFEKETRRLQMVVFDLEQSVISICLERETLEEALRSQKEMLTAQISALESDVSRLQQVEVQLTAEIKISADLRQQREELEGKVVSLDKMVHALHAEIQGLEVERASQQDVLNALIIELQSAKNTVQEYEKKLEEHQKVVAENVSLKKEACTLQQELDEHLQAIGDLQGQINVLRQEKTEGENQVSQALTKIESLQTHILELSEQISLKDEEIRNLRNEYDSVDHELKLVKEQNIEINELIKSNRKEHEETVKKLQQELHSASSAASEKQEEMLVLSAEVTSLKEQICRYSENEVQKQQEMSVLETKHNVLQENLTSLLNQLAEATATASHKDSELLLVQNEIHQQKSLRKKAQELETAKREELERTVSELQAKILQVSTLTSERDAQVISLQDEMKDQQLRAKQAEDDLRRELEEKVGNLQGELDVVNRCAADKDNQLGSLDQKLKEMEGLFLQKEKDILEMHQAKEDLEKRLVDEKQQLEEYQQKWEMVIKERDHLSIEVTSLSDKICSYQDIEVQKQQAMSVLEVECNQLKENMATLEKKLLEEATTASQKNSELLLLQNELLQQERIREKAHELETAKREELERTVSELQAKIQQVSTLASEREASLQNELKDQLRAKQSEDDLRRELEEKVETLKGELDAVNRCAADKDSLLGSLDQKLKEMEGLFLQKEKDVLELHQAKEDLEKRIHELVVEEQQQLEEYQQNLEMVRREKDHLSTEVTSLNDKIHSYQDTEVQKQQEMSVLKVECNLLKENMVTLEKKLLEETTTASQNNSELLLLQNELHQQERIIEKAQEIETAKREELERTVSELQAKILEVSTLASEREASLQNELKDQLRAKQAEDDLRRELEEKIANLQGELDAVNRCAVDKDNQLGSLDQKLKEMEGLFLQKEKDILEMHQAKEDLEKRLVDEKQQLEEYQQKWEMVIKERDHLSIEVTSLSDKICSYQDTEVQKQQAMSVLEVECNRLKENMATLEKKLLEEATTASQKNSELLLLQNELLQQECIREKAHELETAKREELERTVSELQAKIQQVSTLASEREASHQNELEDQLRAKQSEDGLRGELEEKIETLQRQLETATLEVTNKDQLLQTLYQKLNQTQLLCQQKEKDVLDMHQVKEDFEKRIDELVVEKQQLEGHQQNLEMVRKEREHLSTEVTSLNDKIRSYQESEVQKQQEMSVLEGKHNTLMENFAALKMQVAELTTAASQKESELLLLQKESCEQKKLREKAQDLEKDVSELQAKIQEVSALASEREAQISYLQNEMNDQQLRAKQSEDDLRTALEEKVETLQRQLDTANCEVTDKKHLLESLDQKLRQTEVLCQQKEKDVTEMHQAKEELEKRIVELHADKHQLDGYQQNLEMLRQERSHLTSLSQSLQRECDASQKIRAELELKVEEKNGSILALKKASRQWEEQNQELLEQLKTKSEAVEHYKSQVEKAKNHYNGKKQLLVEAQELNKNFEQSLEASKSEVKALEVELKLARMELDQANAKEKNLAAKVKNLEAQVDFADRQLREPRKMTDDIEHMRHRESQYIRVPEKRQDTSTDSLEFELNDSLNPDSRSAVPGESSTPLVRSSERLAAKRRALGAESLETLYFTPMGQQGNKRKADHNDAFDRKLESSITSIGDLVVDSAKKLTASARRRRTTQVINITLAKKTPGSAEGEESFSSLHSARSQPNLAVHHSRPISMDLSEESSSKTDTLQNLPGYRRSAVHTIAPPRATSTFCIGAENEPEHASDDWMRIAELQARNKVCLPHLKSSYPLESRPSLGPSFTVTDDDLRTGDPDETIRRASMAPSQILETLNSRRFSLAPGASSTQGPALSQPQRATMLPGQIRSSTAAHRASQLTKTSSHLRASENKRSPLAPKRPGSQLQGPDTPEAKKLASCFPRPMTPKGRFGNSQNRPPNSPAERRQSVVFTVVNTPKTSGRGDSRLQRGLNKLRNSARKSPGVASRALRSAVSARSPLDSTLRKSPRIKSPKSSNAKKGIQ